MSFAEVSQRFGSFAEGVGPVDDGGDGSGFEPPTTLPPVDTVPDTAPTADPDPVSTVPDMAPTADPVSTVPDMVPTADPLSLVPGSAPTAESDTTLAVNGTLRPGEVLDFVITSPVLLPTETSRAVLRSSPVDLGSAVADANHTLIFAGVRLPSDWTDGAHSVTIYDADGVEVLSITFQSDADSAQVTTVTIRSGQSNSASTGALPVDRSQRAVGPGTTRADAGRPCARPHLPSTPPSGWDTRLTP